VVPLGGDRVTIGRSSENHLVIDAGMIVSSHHAALTREPADGSWWIEDCVSKNGTFVN
jgi:pSer/pThr/pTyr-binding forkhead associated (FHA) protein